jgi:lysozyme family protein
MSFPSYRNKWPVYQHEWDTMQIKPGRGKELAGFVKRAMAGKVRYQEVEAETYVLWWIIAIIAERESGQDFSRSLVQGDHWNRRSSNEPISGPFPSWKAAAEWSLHHEHMDIVKDWRLEKALYYFEADNGWGYYKHGLPSSYVWGATTIQRPGKYTSDGHWSASTWDTQLGCAAMLRVLMNADSSIKPIRED